MPVLDVADSAHQRILRERRRLLSPREAAERLGITRQAIDKAALKPDGPLLVWRFLIPGRRDLRQVDFGALDAAQDPHVWSESALDPWELLAEPGLADASSDDEVETILHLLASGLVMLSDDWPARGSVLPYPPPLQRALDRLTLRCWRLGHSPPRGVPHLVERSAEPIRTWLHGLPCDVASDGDLLIVDGFPTSFCREWSVESALVEDEILERRLMKTALSICRAQDNEEAYRRFRKLLIEQPVITALDLQRYCTDPELHRLAKPLRECYTQVPLDHTRNGNVRLCSKCAHLIIAARFGEHCSNDRCSDWATPTADRNVPLSQDPLWLRPPIRTFVALPGLAELRLSKSLRKLGVDVTLWPAFDAYDLRVQFPDGAVWAVDVKDWASPVALARHLASAPPFRSEPPWTRAFFVFPSHRIQSRPDYLRVFRHFYRSERACVASAGEGSFLRQVAAYLAQLGRRS